MIGEPQRGNHVGCRQPVSDDKDVIIGADAGQGTCHRGIRHIARVAVKRLIQAPRGTGRRMGGGDNDDIGQQFGAG
ncbi:hypothetical protein D9M72_365140 [compost metagenome]